MRTLDLEKRLIGSRVGGVVKADVHSSSWVVKMVINVEVHSGITPAPSVILMRELDGYQSNEQIDQIPWRVCSERHLGIAQGSAVTAYTVPPPPYQEVDSGKSWRTLGNRTHRSPLIESTLDKARTIEQILTEIVYCFPDRFIAHPATAAWPLIGRTCMFKCSADRVKFLFCCSELHQYLVCLGAFHSICRSGLVCSMVTG